VKEEILVFQHKHYPKWAAEAGLPVPCTDCKFVPFDHYMVWDELWAKAGLDPREICCLECLERRLGRPLGIDDFPLCRSTGWPTRRRANSPSNSKRNGWNRNERKPGWTPSRRASESRERRRGRGGAAVEEMEIEHVRDTSCQ
jgi:hypothetical protein